MKKVVSSVIFTILSFPFFSNDLPIVEYGSINHPVIDDEGMVVSQRMIASEVGAQILAPVSYTHLTLPTILLV